jgi:hypothetical protein
MNVLMAIYRVFGQVYLKVLTLCKLLSDDGDIPFGSYIVCCCISQQTIAAIWYVFNSENLEY